MSPEPKTVICKGSCQRTLALTEENFYKSRTCASGFVTRCKKCAGEQQRTRNKKIREAKKSGVNLIAERISLAKMRRAAMLERERPLSDFDVSCLRDKLNTGSLLPISIYQEVRATAKEK